MESFYILPLKLITIQVLMLLVAIAIEAFVFQQQLRFPPRKSMEYATSLNLFSTIIGWLSFLYLSGPFLLPEALRLQVLNFVFLGQWDNTLVTLLISLSFIIFFGTLAVEWIGFMLLQLILSKERSTDDQSRTKWRLSFRPSIQTQQLLERLSGKSDVLSAILMANAFSYIAIVVLLIVIQLTSVVR